MTDELAEYVLPPNLQWLLDPPPGSSSPSSPEEPLPTLNHIMLPLPAKGISLTWKPSITSNYNRSETQPRKAGIRLEVADQPIKVSSHDDEDVDAATEPEDEDGGTPPPSHPLPAASTIQAPFDNFVHLPPPERKAAAPPDPKPMLTFNQRGIRSRTLTSDIVLLDQQEEQPKDRPAPPSTKPKQSQSSTAKNPVLPVRFTLNAIFRLSQVRKSTVTLSDLQSRPTSNESVFTNLTVLEQGGKPKEVEDDFWVTPKERSIDLPDDDFRDDQEKEPLASSSISPSPHDGQRFPRPAFDALAAPALADRSFVYRKARGFGPRRDNSSQPTLDVTASSPGSASQAETTTVESIRLLPDPLGSLTGPETFHHPETPKSLPSPCPNTHLLLGSSVFELHIPSLSFGPDLTITLPLSCSNPDVPLQCPETDLPAPLAQPPRFSHTSSALSSSNLLGSPIPNRSSVSNHRTTQLHFTYKDDLLLSSICKDMSLNGDNLMSTMACLELGDCLVIQTSAQPTPRQKGRAMGSPVTLLIYHDETTAHCSLGCYRKTLHAVHYYDSMTSLQLEEKARQACFQMLHRLGLTTSEISWQSKHCAQQEDTASCGLHVLENVRAILAGEPVPMHIDVHQLLLSHTSSMTRATAPLPDPELPSVLRYPMLFLNMNKLHGTGNELAVTQQKLTHQQRLVHQANEARKPLLKLGETVRASGRELSRLQTVMLQAQDIQLWCEQNCATSEARLQAFQAHRPPLRPAVLKTQTVEEYPEHLERLRKQTEADRHELRDAEKAFERNKVAWRVFREGRGKEMEGFHAAVAVWEEFVEYAEGHGRLIVGG